MKKRALSTRKLETVLNRVATPIFLLDARRRILFFNSGCETLTGWTAGEVAGHVCDYATSTDPDAVDSLTCSLAPPPEVLAGREVSAPTNMLHRDGTAFTQMLHFFPLADDNGKVLEILGVAVPIREPKLPPETSPARRLHAELAALRLTMRQRFSRESFVCRCSSMLRVLEQIKLAGRSRAGVFILGATGTGREHVARLSHLESDVGNRSFVALDCRRLPSSELKLTLQRLFDAAAENIDAGSVMSLPPGTLYLANVDALPRDLQQMLIDACRAVESDSECRLRLVASSTEDIGQKVDSEILLEEFYFLLTAIRIELPPLRNRGDDLGLLAQAFLEDLNRGEERQVGGFSDDVFRQFQEYNWPGNLDELAQVVSEARDACTGDLIQVRDLPFRFRTGLDAQSVGPAVEPLPKPLTEMLEQVEADHIRAVLEQTRYNKTKAAELLGIPRPRLYRRMQTLGIDDRET